MSSFDKRSAQRFSASWRAMVRPETEAGAFYAAAVADFSNNGFCLIIERDFEEGDRLIFKIYPPILTLDATQQEVMLMGVVRRRIQEQERQGKRQYGVQIEEFFAGRQDYELHLSNYEANNI